MGSRKDSSVDELKAIADVLSVKFEQAFILPDGELKDYVKFKDILIDFREFYGLETYNLKQIVQYVWQLGKDYFPKNYGKKKRGDK